MIKKIIIIYVHIETEISFAFQDLDKNDRSWGKLMFKHHVSNERC